MASRTKNNGASEGSGRIRYWICLDFGLLGNFNRLYEWLDSQGAEECGSGVATFRSGKSRDRLAAELQEILKNTPKARAYVISMKQGGRFVVGNRKAAPWKGYTTPVSGQIDES